MGKKSRSGSGMNILDHISESLETIFWGYNTVLKLFDADANSDPRIFLTPDPGSGMENFRIRDPGYASRIHNTTLFRVPEVNIDHHQSLLFFLIHRPVFFPVMRILFPVCT
jgi:hypothetical protein